MNGGKKKFCKIQQKNIVWQNFWCRAGSSGTCAPPDAVDPSALPDREAVSLSSCGLQLNVHNLLGQLHIIKHIIIRPDINLTTGISIVKEKQITVL